MALRLMVGRQLHQAEVREVVRVHVDQSNADMRHLPSVGGKDVRPMSV